MSIKSLSIVAAATMALFAGAAQAATTNGFANGGFEITGPVATPAASWLKGAAGYSLSTDAHTGDYSAELMSPQFNANVVLQNSEKDGGMPSLMAGDTPSFSFWAKGTAGGTGNVLYSLRYLDNIGNILATTNNVFFQGTINTSTWTQITLVNPLVVPVGATAAFVEFAQNIGPIGIGPAGEDWFAGKVLIDDVYLGVAAIPEPGTYALMLAGLVGVGAMVRRRAV